MRNGCQRGRVGCHAAWPASRRRYLVPNSLIFGHPHPKRRASSIKYGGNDTKHEDITPTSLINGYLRVLPSLASCLVPQKVKEAMLTYVDIRRRALCIQRLSSDFAIYPISILTYHVKPFDIVGMSIQSLVAKNLIQLSETSNQRTRQGYCSDTVSYRGTLYNRLSIPLCFVHYFSTVFLALSRSCRFRMSSLAYGLYQVCLSFCYRDPHPYSVWTPHSVLRE
jgi:hypothetical protein